MPSAYNKKIVFAVMLFFGLSILSAFFILVIMNYGKIRMREEFRKPFISVPKEAPAALSGKWKLIK